MRTAATGTGLLAETERSLRAYGRVVLCQIVRAEGSTPGKVGWKLLARPDGTFAGNLGGGAFEALVKADAQAKLLHAGAASKAASGGPDSGEAGGAPGSGGATTLPGSLVAAGSEVKRYYLTEEAVKGEATGMVCGGMAEVFLEVMEAAPVLVICGGGPVGQALAGAGALAGFDLVVADDREEFRRPELFPGGTALAAVGSGYEQDFLAPIRGRDLFVAVVSRCWDTDAAALAAVLRQAPPHLRYLGLMGSRRKVSRVGEELAARGYDLGATRLHAPIGLSIGGDSPGEIAISILAEVIATRYETTPV